MTKSIDSTGRAGRNFLLDLLKQKEMGVFLALVAIVAFLVCKTDSFASKDNLFAVSRQIAYVAIVALGIFFVIVTSGIDLSVGSLVCLSGVICALVLQGGHHPLLAVLAGLLTGAVAGAINGLLVSYVGVTSFIVTLGMLSVAKGAVLVLTHGDSVRGSTEQFSTFLDFGKRTFLDGRLSMPVVVLLVLAVICYIVLRYTVFGRRLFAVGGNEQATELSGINVRGIKFFSFVIASVASSIVGILYIFQYNSAQSSAGEGMEMDAIAAAVIGGTSLLGGQGSVVGILIGAIMMGVIRNGLVLMKVDAYWQKSIIGAIIVLAAVIDILRSKRK
ncbi:MAG TPA: ABC transporter permease [Candidatus Sumerlaeota bacterium]|nr:ABC transporter permease [Candidatus Sumerlaeota bacterium]HPS00105.1 ABC transporter permease [Candidatus Sumerlaeota bacterium]